MRCLRLALHTLLALVLFAQSLSAAAAPRSLAQPQATLPGSSETAVASMPCHGGQERSTPEPSCCDAACPDMLTCAFAALAPIGDLAPLARPSAAAPPRLQTPGTAPDVTPASLFRPPISPAA
jgi:hypothetical protein